MTELGKTPFDAIAAALDAPHDEAARAAAREALANMAALVEDLGHRWDKYDIDDAPKLAARLYDANGWVLDADAIRAEYPEAFADADADAGE